MIYRLNDEFTKIEETEGMLENKSVHTPIEIVMVNGVPEKDAGFELQPKEKMPFKVKDGESVYARCTNLDHMGANLTVANFNMPASGGAGAGKSERVVLYSGYIKASTGSIPSNLTLIGDANEYDYLTIVASYGGQPFSFILPKEYPQNVVSAALGAANCFCKIIRSGNVIGQSWCSVNGNWSKGEYTMGITRVIGVKGV